MAIVGQGITAYPQPDDALNENSKNPVQNKVVAKEVNDLKSALDAGIHIIEWTDGKYYVYTQAGTSGGSGVATASNLIDIRDLRGKTLKYTAIKYTNSQGAQGVWASHIFIKSDGTFISARRASIGSGYEIVSVTIPETAAFVGFTTTQALKGYFTCDVYPLSFNSLYERKKDLNFVPYSAEKWVELPQGLPYDNLINAKTTDIIARIDTLLNNTSTLFSLTKNICGYATNADGTADNNTPIYGYNFRSYGSLYSSNASYNSEIKPKRVMITGGVHGDEKSAVLALVVMLEQLCNGELPFLANNFDFLIMPICNPKGFDANTRNNAHNVNINRNFTPFFDDYTGIDKGAFALSEYETQAINNTMLSYKPNLFIDNHNTNFSDDWGHNLSFNDVLLRAALSVYTIGIAKTLIKNQSWFFYGQSATQPIIGSKKEPETYAQAWLYNIPAILIEAPYRSNGGHVEATFFTPNANAYAYSRLVNSVISMCEQICVI